ncbi:acetyl-CoA hydrolase/transferase family protein [Mycobacterium sp. HM-7]
MIDLGAHIHPGDTVIWGQACAEPLTLTEALTAQRAALGGITAFIGIQFAGTAKPVHADHIRFVSYCGTGANRALGQADVLDIYPGHYSTLPWLVSRGPLRADVVLVQVSPPDVDGNYSLGLADDYLTAAIDVARVVIAEVNAQVPFVAGSRYLTADDVDVVIESSRPPAESPAGRIDATTTRIAELAAGLVEDGATLQLGIGAVPELLLGELKDRSDLRFHSGQLSDGAAELIEVGAARGGVAAFLIGTRRLFDFAHCNPAIALRPASYTHAADVLATQQKFVAVNSAVEVDVTGQVNAEVAAGSYVGAVGGAADFLRAAARSPGGLPIVALPATRIVAALSGPVSTARSDAGIFVTEYGIADLRGQSLAERRRRLVEIAHPDRREALSEGTS